jgi:hypothetical protein
MIIFMGFRGRGQGIRGLKFCNIPVTDSMPSSFALFVATKCVLLTAIKVFQHIKIDIYPYPGH